jgi:hypothetical protein
MGHYTLVIGWIQEIWVFNCAILLAKDEALSEKQGLKVPWDAMADIFCQKSLNAFLVPSRPPATKPSTSTTALTVADDQHPDHQCRINRGTTGLRIIRR